MKSLTQIMKTELKKFMQADGTPESRHRLAVQAVRGGDVCGVNTPLFRWSKDFAIRVLVSVIMAQELIWRFH